MWIPDMNRVKIEGYSIAKFKRVNTNGMRSTCLLMRINIFDCILIGIGFWTLS